MTEGPIAPRFASMLEARLTHDRRAVRAVLPGGPAWAQAWVARTGLAHLAARWPGMAIVVEGPSGEPLFGFGPN